VLPLGLPSHQWKFADTSVILAQMAAEAASQVIAKWISCIPAKQRMLQR
jgi:hypothetical protein